jgi:opacity protein-like surface antigen
MLKKLISLFFASLCVISTYAFANDNLQWTRNMYIGVDGGFAAGLSKAKSDFGIGATFANRNGMATDGQFLPGWHVGAKIGYRCLGCLRLDASYTFLSSRYNWIEEFGVDTGIGGTTEFLEAKLNVHTALVNAYWHLDGCSWPNGSQCSCHRFSPYIMGGIGAAWNDLHHINEHRSPSGDTPAEIRSRIAKKTTSNFAGRFGIGFLSDLTCSLKLDTGFHITYIGKVQTGNHRSDITDEPPGTVQPIIPTTLRNNWIGVFYLGLVYGL